MRILRPMLLLLLGVSLLAGCTSYFASPPAGQAPPTAASPPTAEARPALPPTITPFPPGYPWPPTEVVSTRWPLPTPTVGPTPIVLGAEWAPEAEREVYISTTVVVAPVGDGPGEVGYWEMPEAGRIWADRFTVDARGNIYILDRVNHRVVRFDPQGKFLGNTPYEGWDIVDLAVDNEGNLYLLRGGDGVRLLDTGGKVLQEFAQPSWLLYVYQDIWVDEQGMVWIAGDGGHPDAPIIEGQPYSPVSVPLGTAREVMDADRQRDLAIPGWLLETGGPVITYSFGDYTYIYNRQGQVIYQCPGRERLWAIDRQNNVYTIDEELGIITKYDQGGKRRSSFSPIAKPFSSEIAIELVNSEGTIYTLVWDFELRDAYRVIRWQQ
ncbi:MAG: hypothetical protein ACP5OO_13310 [Chloroflexia bacterium]